MEIEKIWICQKNLKRSGQIPEMMSKLRELPPIELAETEDGEIQVVDGHHRLMAYYLSGQRFLTSDQYNLTQKTNWRAKIGKIDVLLRSKKCLELK